MKNFRILFIPLIALIASCVDDFEDANPPRLKDGPYFLVTLSDDAVTGGESFTFNINVVDAPGGIDSVAIVNTQGEGTYSFNNLNNVKGQSQAEITGTYTAPTTFNGKLDLDFILYDAQVDDKGNSAAKSATVRKSVTVGYPGKLSKITVDFPTTTFVRGSSIDFEINVDSAASGVDTIYIIANRGLAVINQSDYNNIVGKESGKVRVKYTADVEYVGPVTLTVYVIDVLQKRISSNSTTLTANYQFAAPTVDLSIVSTELKVNTPVNLSVTINAPGTIEDIFIESFEVRGTDIGDELGEPMLKENEVNDLLGKTSGTVTGSFTAETKGYYNLRVSVIDEQGRLSTDNVEVLVRP